MLYREGTSQSVSVPADSVFIVSTASYTLLLGVVFVIAGMRGRQRWLCAWGGLTVLVCATYLLARVLGHA